MTGELSVAEIVGICLCAVLIFQFIAAMILLKVSRSYPARTSFRPLERAGIPADALAYFDAHRPDLEAVGFMFVSYLDSGPVKMFNSPGAPTANQPTLQASPILSPFASKRNSGREDPFGAVLTSTAETYTMLLYNRQSADMAQASYAVLNMGESRTKVARIEFSRRFADGTGLMTHNYGLGVFKRDPRRPEVYLPSLKSARKLYRAHKAAVRRYKLHALASLPPEGEEIKDLEREHSRGYARQAKFGNLELRPDGSAYRATWKGACYMAWKFVLPVPIVRRLICTIKAFLLLRAVGPE